MQHLQQILQLRSYKSVNINPLVDPNRRDGTHKCSGMTQQCSWRQWVKTKSIIKCEASALPPLALRFIDLKVVNDR